jgi:hypothetical protein
VHLVVRDPFDDFDKHGCLPAGPVGAARFTVLT